MSWSGGKDSSLALHALRASEDVNVVALLTSVTSGYDRVSIHGVRAVLLEHQADALGVPLVRIELQPQCSNAEYEDAFHEALGELDERHPEVECIAFGDLYLADVRAYRDQLLAQSRYSGLYPIWGQPTKALANRFIDVGFEATVVCVDTMQLDAGFAGRSFDESFLADLPSAADPCGENGEFHTFVHAGPIFTAPMAIERGEIVLRENRFAYCDLLPGGQSVQHHGS